MNANSVNIAVVDGKTITQTVDLGAAKTGLPVRIKAVQGGKYIIGEGEKGFAPENLTIKRVGKNLHIALEGTDPDQAQLIIENFEGSGGQLVGLAEDGSYYEYISSDGDQDGAAAFLYDGAESAQVLGAQPLAGFGNGLVAGAGIGWFWPALLGLGALGLLGGVYAATRNKDDNNDPTTPVGGGNGDKGSLGSVIDDVGDKQGLIGPGESTDDKTPTFTGIGRPGTTVEIVDNGKVIGTAPVGDDGKWEFTPAEPGLADGSHNIVIVPVDAGGNKGEPSPGHIIIVDTVAPAAPLIDSVYDDTAPNEGLLASGDSTNDTTPTLKGTAEAGAIVHIYDNGEPIGTALADEHGNWEFTPKTELAEGAHEFTIAAEDAAGNISVPSLPFPIVIDITAPEKPGPGKGGIDDIFDNVGPVQGSIGDGDSTDDKTPTFSGGGATPGDTVVIIDNGEPIGSVVVGDDGKWEFTPETGKELAEGSHEIVVVIKDPSGNPSEPSDPITIIVDTQAPVTPTLGAVIDNEGDSTGNLNPGDVTDDARPELTGTAEPGSVVTIYDNGAILDSVTAGADGSWSFTPQLPLSNGPHSFTVTSTDSAGNVSLPTPAFDLQIVTGGSPSAPAITGVVDDQGSIQGNVSKDATTDDNLPTITGTGTTGDTILIYNGDQLLGTAKVENGQWEFTPETALVDGTYNLTAQAKSPADNLSPATGVYTIIVDTSAPAAPTQQQLIDDVGAVTGPIPSGATTDDSNPTFVGMAEPGSVVMIYDNGALLDSRTADSDGNWSFTPTIALENGPHSLTAQAVDAAGNVGPMGPAMTFIVDATAVEISITSVVDDAGFYKGPLESGESTDDTTPTLNGQATPGATVNIYNGTTLVDSVVADPVTGAWSFTMPALTQGTHNLTATVTTPASGESAPTPAFTVIVDTTAPSAPVIGAVTDDVGTIQGPIGNGQSTDDNTPTLSGEGLEPGDTVEIYDNGELLGIEKVDENGHWSFTPSPSLNDGKHDLTVIARDPAGNPSAPSAPWTVIVDTTAPLAPLITALMDDVGSSTGPISSGGTTDDQLPQISGTAEAGSVVTIFLDGKELDTVLVDDTGVWTFQIDSPLSFGSHEVTVTAKDSAGNVSEESAPFEFVVVASGSFDFENLPLQFFDFNKPTSLTSDLTVTNLSSNAAVGIIIGIPYIPEFGDRIMMLRDESITRFDIKGPTEYVSFSMNGWSSPTSKAIAKYFDADGNLLGVEEIFAVLDDQTNTCLFSSSTANIAYFEVSVDDELGVLFDNLEWGSLGAPTVNEVLGSEVSETLFSLTDVTELENNEYVIDGSDNIDTLTLTGANQVLNLTALAEGQVTSMEVIDITGTGDNVLNLSLSDVLAQGGNSLFTGDDSTQMMIKGNAGDVVNLADLLPDGTDPGDWASAGTATVAGVVYNVYQHSSQDAQLLVQDGVTTNLV
ncbi:Ig-like domain-containing protein [Pseudomonas sp. TE24901]